MTELIFLPATLILLPSNATQAARALAQDSADWCKLSECKAWFQAGGAFHFAGDL